MSKTILVTGGSGFIGAHIIRQLVERGDTVINYDLRPPQPDCAWWLQPVAGQIKYVEGSIEDWGSLARIAVQHKLDAIIHIAAIVNPVLLNRQPRLALNVNLGGTVNILELARAFSIGRVVSFSSIGVLPGVRYTPIDVNHPVLLGSEGPGTNFYGAAKVAEEAFCWAYRQAYGLDVITLRPSAVYGFGMQWPMYIKPMVEDSLLGKAVFFNHGREFPRDYTHVEDVAQLSLLALDAPAERLTDRVFYAATGQPLNTAGQVAELVRELIPGAQIEIQPGLSESDQLEIRYRGVLDISNACVQLGYAPKYAVLRDGLQEYISVYRQYLASKSN